MADMGVRCNEFGEAVGDQNALDRRRFLTKSSKNLRSEIFCVRASFGN